jgi:hypothetical protein
MLVGMGYLTMTTTPKFLFTKLRIASALLLASLLIGCSTPTYDEGRVGIMPERIKGTKMPGREGFLVVYWRCDADELYTYLQHRKRLYGNRGGDVIVRTKFNFSETSQARWYKVGTNHKHTFFDRQDVNPFTSNAIKSERLIIQVVSPFDGESVTAAFDTVGLERELVKLPCYR